jgi:hypothetical protein
MDGAKGAVMVLATPFQPFCSYLQWLEALLVLINHCLICCVKPARPHLRWSVGVGVVSAPILVRNATDVMLDIQIKASFKLRCLLKGVVI